MLKPILISFRRLAHGKDLPLPTYATGGSAGLDLLTTREIYLPPGKWELVPTGLAIAIPPGYEMQIRPRSGLALSYGITVLNSPGTIDSDYREEVKVLLYNAGDVPYIAKRGSKIAQAVIAQVVQAGWTAMAELPPTGRKGGFGSTGA